MNIHHEPVLKDFIVQNLLKPQDEWVLDATLGEGGHTEVFLAMGKQVIAFERDPQIAVVAHERLKKFLADGKLVVHQANYHAIKNFIEADMLKDKIDFVLFDLGISKFHYKAGNRGFSFQVDEPLDMRLDLKLESTLNKSEDISAREIINTWREEDMANLFYQYGEETLSRPCARLIVKERESALIESSMQLAELIKRVYAKKNLRTQNHPATKVFQALRIAVNQELEHIATGVSGAINVLKQGGRLAVISYHSLEDRIVKNTFKEFLTKRENVNKYLVPKSSESGEIDVDKKQFSLWNKKIIRPEADEIRSNPAARSACLRVIERT